jgi:uncharacterized BrkB/YihY/UPF0761 family membrane protein
MKKLFASKAGSSYWFMYTLLFIFATTLLYIIFSQILHAYLYPVTIQISGGQTAAADRWMGFWGFVPFIIVLILGLFIFFRLTQRDTMNE